MRVRILIISIFAAVVALANGAVASSPHGLTPYSPDWLAKYHTMYDNQMTADYEKAVGYNGPAVVGSASPFAPADVRMSNAGFAGNQNEFQIDINPLDSHHAIGVSNDGRTTGVGFYRTHDFGQTWAAGDLPLGQSACCDPGFAYSADGTGYAVILDTSPATNWVMKTTNNGDTWTLAGSTPGDDRENIVVDNSPTSPHQGRIYITYSDFGTPNEIRLFYSDNQGANWTGPINVSHTNATDPAYPQSSQPRVANDGTVYVGFQFYPNGTYASAKDMIAKSTDGGNTFLPATTISAGPHLQGGLDLGDQRGYFAVNGSCSTFRHRSFPIIGVSPANSQQVYAMWAGGNLEQAYSCGGLNGFHSDVLFSRSNDGGATWSAPIKVNDDPPGHDQYYPWMDVAPDGTIWIGWHDRRDDPQNFKHIWYMDRSRNGGVSFGTDVKIGDVASQPDFFIGDYAGLAAANKLVLPMWWDSRNSTNGDPYTQVIRP